MASWMVHLRIADKLLPHLNNIDETGFVVGNMAPDSGVPNADWSEFRPPYSVTHFKKKTDEKSRIDVDAFCDRYFSEETIRGYDQRTYSFFLGYYTHLLTDIRWSKTVVAALKEAYPEEAAADKEKLIRAAKEDWYDLDYLYLEEHPDFRAFSIYEDAADFDNAFMDLFARDAFENRRRYICDFYRNGDHGDLHRDFRYLMPERANAFVKETVEWILEQETVRASLHSKKYYEAYDERYKTIHKKGLGWASEEKTPIVFDTIERFSIRPNDQILEIGCGEGRDAVPLLKEGYHLLATDVSKEAIAYCREKAPEYAEHFRVLDCLENELIERFRFIYAVAVVHMFVPDDDRRAFYRFIENHLTADGIALVCTMGDGETECKSNIETAFELRERDHPGGTVKVTGTSLRMVSFPLFEKELLENGLDIIEKGITSVPQEFNQLMYAIVKTRCCK